MGNSPSRSEIQGDHMPSVVNTTPQESFQSHSYPTKFQSVHLPGIHQSTPPSRSHKQHGHHDLDHNRHGGGGGGARSTGPHSPDPLYSMDSLNVAGNSSGTSITSAELPPSSLSPMNRRDSTYSYESLHTQCRNLSRLHKDLHRDEEEEGLSSSTYESDSLNPDATLFDMLDSKPSKYNVPRKPSVERESSVKPEVAEEAIEVPPKVSNGTLNSTDCNITINGRKISTCVEIPLPLLLTGRGEVHSKDLDNRSVSSKIEVTSSELNTIKSNINGSSNVASAIGGTLKTNRKSRMTSPPPPPPTGKSTGQKMEPSKNGTISHSLSSSNLMESLEKKFFSSSSLNSLLRSSSRRSSIEISDNKAVCGGDVNIIQTPLVAELSEIAASPVHNGGVQQVQRPAENPNKDVNRLISANKTDNNWKAPSEGIKMQSEIRPIQNNLPFSNSIDSKANEFNESEKFVTKTAEKIIENGSSSINATVTNASVSLENVHDEKISLGLGPRSSCADTKTQSSAEEAVNEQSQRSEAELDCKDNLCSVSNATDEIKQVSSTMLDKAEDELMKGNNSIITTETINEKTNFSCNMPKTFNGLNTNSCTDSLPSFPTIDTTKNTQPKMECPTAKLISLDISPTISLKEETNFSSGSDFAVNRKDETRRESTPPKRSNSSLSDKNSGSRRGSNASSLDMGYTAPTNHGLLNCNRLSLCSLPDNEVDNAEHLDTFTPLNEVTILDQPVSSKQNENIGETINVESSTLQDEQNVVKNVGVRSFPDCREIVPHENLILHNEEIQPTAELNSTIQKNEPIGGSKSNSHGHQRRLSISCKIDLESTKSLEGSCSAMPSNFKSVSTEKIEAKRKASFPELYVHTNGISSLFKSNGSTTNMSATTKGENRLKNGLKKSMSANSIVYGQSNKSQFSNDFLQTLGEIYASKSKLLTNRPPVSTTESRSLGSEENGSCILITQKSKPPERPIDTVSVDTFDCQDRSISEYNISPRSAREVMTESLLNCSSSSSSLSPKSIITSPDIETKPPADSQHSHSFEKEDMSKSNKAWKSPTDVELAQSVSPALSTDALSVKNEEKGNALILEKEVRLRQSMPPPPPLPPLQYCHSVSDSASDSSSPSFTNSEGNGSDIFIQGRGLRRSPEKNGNISTECSLIELQLPQSTQKSTSDAIIVELKKAQAMKLKAAEQRQGESVFVDFGSNKKFVPPPLGLKRDERESKTRQQDTKCEGESPPCKSSPSTLNNSKKPEELSEKTVVSTPPKRISQIGSVQGSKKSIALSKGNIMSPSLSGNYTEMNGIDSETMGASSIHEDELSGQLQQKENHINELHGNLDEVQTSNKLDGASFRRVLNEYEKTLSMFIQQIDQLKQRMEEAETEKQTLIKERDQALEDLRNVESAFSDVHRKYERAKALLENMKSNEDTLIRRDQEMMQRIQNRDKKIDLIKEKAQESIEKMHLDYETRIKEMDFENAKLRAQYRKMEMKLSTLENDVEQKAKENAQLSALCDELINGQVGQV